MLKSRCNPDAEFGEQQLGDFVGLFEVRIARGDHRIDAERLILTKPRRYGLGVADQRGSRAAPHEPDTGPEIGRDFKLVALAAAMQRGHALLSDRIRFGCEFALRRGDGIVRKIGNELIGDAPGLAVGFANDEMNAQAEPDLAPSGRRAGAYRVELLGYLRDRLAPGQINVGLLGGEVERWLGGAAEPYRHAMLDRRKQLPGAADFEMAAVEVDAFSGQEPVKHGQKFGRLRVAFVVTEENAVASEFLGIAAGDQIDQKPAVADAVDRGSLARKVRRRTKPGAERREKAQAFGVRSQGRGDDPRLVAMRTNRNERSTIAQPVSGLRDLLEIVEVRRPVANVAAEIGAIPADGNEPEHIKRLSVTAHDSTLICYRLRARLAPNDVAH